MSIDKKVLVISEKSTLNNVIRELVNKPKPYFGFACIVNNSKQLKGVFKKIVTMPIENEINSVSANELYKVATKNNFKAEKSENFLEALKKISDSEKKLIVCFGSLYNCGNILNKN